MVHATRTSTASAPAPLSTRHFLIGRSAIKNARNSPETNALDFSNRLINACFRAPFSHLLRPKNRITTIHESHCKAIPQPVPNLFVSIGAGLARFGAVWTNSVRSSRCFRCAFALQSNGK